MDLFVVPTIGFKLLYGFGPVRTIFSEETEAEAFDQ
jgi:hypothetical protein